MIEPLSIRDRSLRVVEEHICHSLSIDENSTWEELGLDSLDKMALTMDIEDEFGIDLADDTLIVFNSINELVELLERIAPVR